MKPCRKCAQPFDPTPYQLRKSDFVCTVCKREYDAAWRRAREAAGLPARGPKPPKEWWDAYFAAYHAKPEVKQRKAAQMRDYRKLPHIAPKVAARVAVRNAVRRGDLKKQPCAICGEARVHAHHADYSKPLDVAWLCRPHHEAMHAKAEGRS